MKCQHCGSEIDDEIEIDEWYNCPMCGMPMFGFGDDMLDVGVDVLIRDMRQIEKRLCFLTSRLHKVVKTCD
jgi:hypothetical protein